MVDKNQKLVRILVAVIVILLVIVLYSFLIKPQVNGYAVKRQQEGYRVAIIDIASLAAQCQQPVPLNVGFDKEGNPQTIHLIALECYPELIQDSQLESSTEDLTKPISG